ncbi:sodium:proton antiporter [Microbacterium sp. X-17]|uniref:cation:proton antiporter n=1 Tax=Microbacterium sp. X-17 TaxID=3144404 RepID=UPI0031F5B5FD
MGPESYILIFIAVIAGVALVAAVGQRLGIASPLLLVAIGLTVSVLPFFPALHVNPEWILAGVLPPLLYSSAVSVPAVEFRRDLRPISLLAVALVIVSAVLLGLFFAWVIPGLGIAMGIALGAILSPTDAVATSIVKRLGISSRVTTLLEGESLLNDATALVLLRTAIAAVAAGFSFGAAVGAFLWSTLIAVVIGSLVGFFNLRVRAWIRHSPSHTALSFAIPFLAYFPTEALGGSGFVAAVAAGIVTGQGAARWFTPDQRISEELNWRTIELVLEGSVFLLMGLELKEVFTANLQEHDGLWHGGWLALSAVGIIMAVRVIFVVILVALQARRARGSRVRRQERLEQISTGLDERDAGPPPDRRMKIFRVRVTSALADLDYYRATPLNWRHGAIIVWAGMRGVVTLAAAQTLPEDAAQRSLLIFVAFLVAVGSLLVQGFSLPLVVRAVGLQGTGDAGPSPEEHARLLAELRTAAARALADPRLRKPDGEPYSADFLTAMSSRLTEPPDDDTTTRVKEMRFLRLAMIDAMRTRLTELSAYGTYSTVVLRHTLAELDADQISIELRSSDDDDL